MLLKLIYVGDPMCSWCWGFAAEIDDLAGEYPVELVVGGLRPGPAAQLLDDTLADLLGHHWEQVRERTGQPFDTSFLDRRDGWVYDTEPAAIGVALMREVNETEALNYFTSVQHAFYSVGDDVTDFDVLAELAAPFQVDQVDFRSQLESEEAKKAAWSDFARARSWGITGFPSLVGALTNDRLVLLARGWTLADTIRARIDSLDEVSPG